MNRDKGSMSHTYQDLNYTYQDLEELVYRLEEALKVARALREAELDRLLREHMTSHPGHIAMAGHQE